MGQVILLQRCETNRIGTSNFLKSVNIKSDPHLNVNLCESLGTVLKYCFLFYFAGKNCLKITQDEDGCLFLSANFSGPAAPLPES